MNLEPETRNGYFISAEMKKVWAVEMELLNKLLDVCKKYNLRIWAEGGTLLGAVREHGYIPWDDDIDMVMPRKDYDKLREVASEVFKSPYFFQCGYTDLFPNGFTRLRMDGTAAILYNSIYHKCHQGIFIDIFPLDAVPNNDDAFERFLYKKVIEKEKMRLFCENHFSFTNFIYDWKVLKAKMEIWRMGFHSFFSKYDNLVKQFSQESYNRVSIFSWIYDDKYLRQLDWYDDTTYIPFEDIMIPVPTKYDEILKTQFGNYMNPVKVGTNHGGFLVLDSEHSYKEYLPKLRKVHRWDSLKEWINIIIKFFKG